MSYLLGYDTKRKIAGNVVGDMDRESLKLFLQNVEEYVMDEDRIVS
jgi:hypothetical protein